ncbi:DUF739 family protein [Peptostreptococcus faecalis]|uniref:DUF739 family protein n=1 Tax=Peptostreptococcus faecalis TaxID=2045015 RepID=UPI000C7D6AC2|nr:DUF739 family protein [Peptostreptococcus faecalis]
MEYDYSKLRGLIREKCGTQEKFARAIGISGTSLSQRLGNRIPFSQNEIAKACEIFGFTIKESDDVFFKIKNTENRKLKKCFQEDKNMKEQD